MREGRFRSDLYHRLSVFPIHVPPLRERREDIPLLAAYLVTRKARQLGRHIERISSEILDRLTAYDWPGNVREMENVIERAIILSPGTSIRPQAVRLGSVPSAKPASATPTTPSLIPGKAIHCKRASGRTSSASARRQAGRSKARLARPTNWGSTPAPSTGG